MTIRRRPSVATVVAVIVTLALGTQTGLAARSSHKGRDLQPVTSIEVTATDASSVTISWPPVRDRDVVGYGIYINGTQVGKEIPEHVKRWRDRDALSYTVQGLACGTGYTLAVDAVDGDDDHSRPTSTTVSTAACPDTKPPSSPTGVRQVAATENSVVLAWSPASDNVGVIEYGLYASGVRVQTVTDPSATLTGLSCGTAYLIGLDSADAAGNRSSQVASYFRTSACPSTNKPPSTPTGLKVTAATTTSVSLTWSPSTDDGGGVAGYGLYVSGTRAAKTPRPAPPSRGCSVAHLHSRRRCLRRRRQALDGRGAVDRHLRMRPASHDHRHGDADDRERVDPLGSGQLAGRLRPQRRQRTG